MENKELDDIVKQHIPKLRSFVRGRVSNRDDADDIVQDTLYQLVGTMRVLENPIAHISSWLYTVAHNLIVNHDKKRREERIRKGSDIDDDDFMGDLSEVLAADEADNPDMQILRRMVWQELRRALDELPPEQRMAIELTEIKGLSVHEAAQRMQVSDNTFLSRKHYAVVRIRKRLNSLYQELIQK